MYSRFTAVSKWNHLHMSLVYWERKCKVLLSPCSNILCTNTCLTTLRTSAHPSLRTAQGCNFHTQDTRRSALLSVIHRGGFHSGVSWAPTTSSRCHSEEPGIYNSQPSLWDERLNSVSLWFFRRWDTVLLKIFHFKMSWYLQIEACTDSLESVYEWEVTIKCHSVLF